MQANKTYHHHHPPPPPHESLFSNSNGGFDFEEGTSIGSGSLFFNTISNQFASMSNNMYDVVGADVSSVLQTSLSFASSVGGMSNVNMRVPFTTAQRQELERQITIYKYIMSPVPVPRQLLVPIYNTTTPSNQPTQVKGGSLELGITNSCTDPEPWRCRRTDGKKWRCSRDVILDQKYCERHSHKCRFRSRKPVELNHHFNNNNNSSNKSPYSKSQFLNHIDRDKNNNNNHQSSSSISSTGVSVSATSHDQLRCLEWFMKGENFPVAGSNQELQQMMNAKLGLSRDVNDSDSNIDIPKQQQHERAFFNLCGDDLNSLFVIPKLTPFELGTPSTHQSTQETRHFIDAWSTPETERDHHHVGFDIGSGCCGSSSNEKLSFSSLTLAMCGGNDYETNNDHENQIKELSFGHFGNMGSEGPEQVGNMKYDQSQWLNPVSWTGSASGGPLAEALCLGIAGSTGEASSRGCNSSGTTSSKSSC